MGLHLIFHISKRDFNTSKFPWWLVMKTPLWNVMGTCFLCYRSTIVHKLWQWQLWHHDRFDWSKTMLHRYIVQWGKLRLEARKSKIILMKIQTEKQQTIFPVQSDFFKNSYQIMFHPRILKFRKKMIIQIFWSWVRFEPITFRSTILQLYP